MEQPTFADLEYDGKEAEDPAGEISGTHGWTDSVGPARGPHPTVLSEGGPRASSLRSVSDVAHSLCAVVLQPRPSPGQVLSDPAMEDMLYEIESVRRFVGVRLSGPLPDETTILNFRHLLDTHDLGKSLFEEINVHLESRGLRLQEGDDSGCEHNRGAVVYEESGWCSRPRDAPDEEGQRVVLRDESAYWGGFSDGHGTQRMYDIGQCT